WLSGQPSGSPFVRQDWTGDEYNADGSDGRVNTLVMGMGNPLEPGTYYLGVYADGQSSYTLRSRGIGDGLSIPISELAFAGGSATRTLAAREGGYFRVVIPPDTPSWKVNLSPISG